MVQMATDGDEFDLEAALSELLEGVDVVVGYVMGIRTQIKLVEEGHSNSAEPFD